MNIYQTEQLETLLMVRRHFEGLPGSEIAALHDKIADYLAFRTDAAIFLESYFAPVCTASCYRSQISACCSKDGIITFFGDVVVNMLTSRADEVDRLERAIRSPESERKCIYLSQKSGCLWRVKPIVCEMFLCREARQQVFENRPDAMEKWGALERIKKGFTWPDKPVLFEVLERDFLRAGLSSPLMYIHTSPGLIRIRKNRKSG